MSTASSYGDGSKPWYLVNIKIAGKWMFIPLKMVFIGIDPYPYLIDLHRSPISPSPNTVDVSASLTAWAAQVDVSGAPQPRAHPAAERPASVGESDRRSALGGALPAGEAGGVGAPGGPVQGGRFLFGWMIGKVGEEMEMIGFFWGFEELHGDFSRALEWESMGPPVMRSNGDETINKWGIYQQWMGIFQIDPNSRYCSWIIYIPLILFQGQNGIFFTWDGLTQLLPIYPFQWL